jgi:hypothetical protein
MTSPIASASTTICLGYNYHHHFAPRGVLIYCGEARGTCQAERAGRRTESICELRHQSGDIATLERKHVLRRQSPVRDLPLINSSSLEIDRGSGELRSSLLDQSLRMPDGLDLALARCLQQP